MTKIIFPYSRLYCDVERLVDDLEPMFKKGRGFYYSKTDDGTELRAVDNKHKAKVFSSYYEPHHQKLTSIVSEKLEAIGFVHIIDCHSFSPVPLQTEEDQNPDRPDFCLGIDDFHTPQYLYLPLKNYLEGEGYSVAINRPYKGTIVPLSFYQNDKNVSSMMIEINQKLYVDNGKVNSLEVIRLQTLLKNYFSSLGT
jgi:N-formylglutamate amidohydrolase